MGAVRNFSRHAPAALLIACVAIAFAGAAFGLIVAGYRTHSRAVLPVARFVIILCGDRRMLVANRLRTDVDAKFGARAAHHLAMARVQRFDDPSSHGVECAGSDCRKFGFGIIYTIFGVAIARRRFG